MAKVCQRDRKDACDWRYAMIRQGLCWYSWEMEGWVVIRSGVPTPFERCPSCGGHLPILIETILRTLAEREED